MSPDADFTFLYLKSKKYVKKTSRYGSVTLPKLKIPVFSEILMLISDFISITLRQVKIWKKCQRHKIDVKFSAKSIPTVWISIDIDYHLEILDFLLIFDFLASPCFYPYSEFRFEFYGKFYMGYSVLKIFSYFYAYMNKIRK